MEWLVGFLKAPFIPTAKIEDIDGKKNRGSDPAILYSATLQPAKLICSPAGSLINYRRGFSNTSKITEIVSVLGVGLLLLLLLVSTDSSN